MDTLAVLTPSYRPDLRYFVDLHSSVLRHTADDVVHHVVVPNRDVALFSSLESPRLAVHSYRNLLPRSFLPTYPLTHLLRDIPRMSMVAKVDAIDLKRPWPPVRGWVVQQIVKLDIASQVDADVVLIIDSDVALIRPIGVGDFLRDGAVRFYRLPDGVTPDMSAHVAWRFVANRLLGLEEQASESATDYVAAFVPWDPQIVRKVQQRVQELTATDWRTAIAHELHFSECFMYGIYVDRLGTSRERSFTRSETLCRSHWGTTPLDKAGAARFLESIQPDDVAIHIQSGSNTPDNVRRYILAAATNT